MIYDSTEYSKLICEIVFGAQRKRSRLRSAQRQRRRESPQLQRTRDLATPVSRKSTAKHKSAIEELNRKNRAANEHFQMLERKRQAASQRRVDAFMKWQSRKPVRKSTDRTFPAIMSAKKLARLRKKNNRRAKISSQEERQVCETWFGRVSGWYPRNIQSIRFHALLEAFIQSYTGD